MARNIEIKAHATDLSALEHRAAALASEGPVEIFQDDTFFQCANGRLKLRKFAPDHGELIFYQRSDVAGPKASFYRRASTCEPDTLCQTLALAYGVVGRVIKRRTLYMVGRTRVHLDRVKGLGEFVELEVVLDDLEELADGEKEARTLMTQLAIQPADLLQGAYVDLLGNAA